MTDAIRWRALTSRDANFDGTFVYCVKTTRIYCRPACKSRLARRSNVEFRDTAESAELAGYRACKRCQPQLSHSFEPEADKIRRVCKMLDTLKPHAPLPGLQSMASEAGLTKHHFHRQFKRLTQMTPREYAVAARSGSTTPDDLPPSSEASPVGLEDEQQGSAGGSHEHARMVLAQSEKPPCHYTTTETTFGPLLIVFQHQQVCKLELCADRLEVLEVLERSFPSRFYSHHSLNHTRYDDAASYQEQIDAVVEALERPSGKVLAIASPAAC